MIALLWPGLLEAQESGESHRPALAVHVVTLEHQSARQALEVVLPLLSPQGSVEVRPGGNTLVLRDHPRLLSQMVAAVADFDHPAGEIELAVWLVEAMAWTVSPVPPPDPAFEAHPGLLERLTEHLPYASYELLAASRGRGREGEVVTFDLEGAYTIRLRLGTVLAGQRLRLSPFEVLRSGGSTAPVLRSSLNVWLGKPLILGMSSGERRSLMVVLECRSAAARPQGGR